MSKEERTKNLLGDLGKPTLRGVRKCPKCGTYNGTRGVSCKNKTCDVQFKAPQLTTTRSMAIRRRQTISPDAVRIVTGNNDHVYSVRVRDRGPDYRGFVQLPNIPVTNVDGVVADEAATVRTEDAIARCFVETCIRFVPEEDEVQPDTCHHIKGTLSCDTEAEPLLLKNTVLNALNVCNEAKQAVWVLATESPGPLVQRVSKTVMVVKCKVDQRHPLGFLHFSFFESSRNKTVDYRFMCSCKEFRTSRMTGNSDDYQRRCVHFYACICAFSSDERLSEEFSYYINLDITTVTEVQLVNFLSDVQDSQVEGLKLEVIGECAETSSAVLPKTRKKRRNPESKEGNNIVSRHPDVNNQNKKNQSKRGLIPVEESRTSFSFMEWLAGVTERINQTMHYQFHGKPEPLVFLTPETFFECLQQRIATGLKKKRLPNVTTAFVNTTSVPLGVFSKYIWHINNVIHVKQIFDTPEMPLDITRSFVENRDGTYDLYEAPKQLLLDQNRSDIQPVIKPFELKTFLKVGYTSPDQKLSTPFIIEWIPNILPKSKIGELKLKFEYGHQRNGQIEHRQTSVTDFLECRVENNDETAS